MNDATEQQAEPTPGSALPPDPAEYDSPRAQMARAKGLQAPYIAGGFDPGAAQTRVTIHRVLPPSARG